MGLNLAQKETILFVDDEETILEIAEEYFNSLGYGVFKANNGREAIDILKSERIDCCFTDINMPVMDGLELAEFIQKFDNTLPVIIMTGYPSLDNSIKTLKNGVVDFLIKPINLRQMELSVQRVLRQRSLFTENLLLTREIEGKQRLEHLNKELLFKVDELNTLNRIMTNFTTIATSSDLFKRLVDLSIELTRADEARLYVINENLKDAFKITSSYLSNEAKMVAEERDKENRSDKTLKELIFSVQADEKPLLISENNGQGNLPAYVRSLLVVPLSIRERIFGVLTLLVNQGDKRFSEKDLYYLTFMNKKAAYSIENLALYENIYENLFSTLYAFVKATEARDPYTQQHSNRVTEIAIAISKELNCTLEDQEILNVAGRLHDIGKIGIRDEILLKPGRLTVEEYNIIKEHPSIGADIVAQLGLWDREKYIIECHHERFDGNGYPGGLKGDDIPLLARILSVSDVYDAIASDRAYRKKMAEKDILEIMYGGAGTQFDPEIVKAFKTLYDHKVIEKIVDPKNLRPSTSLKP